MSEPVEIVELTHLEAMGAAIALKTVKVFGEGLSEPQEDALAKLEKAIAAHMKRLGITA